MSRFGLYFILVWALANQAQAQNSSNSATPSPNYEDFWGYEMMPCFPGCETLQEEKARKECTNKAMMSFVYQNLQYPAEAKAKGLEGTAYIRFIVNTEGRIDKIQAIKKADGSGYVDAELEAEALRLIKALSELEKAWRPGEQNGKLIDIRYNLPIKFRLD